jgi:hypothetical protein
MRYFIFALLFLLPFQISANAEEKSYWQTLVVSLNNQLDKAANFYQGAHPQKARRAVIQAYFVIFEGKKLESAMRMELGAQYTYKVEKTFSELRSAIKNKVDTASFAQQVNALKIRLVADAVKLDKAGITPSVFNVQE